MGVIRFVWECMRRVAECGVGEVGARASRKAGMVEAKGRTSSELPQSEQGEPSGRAWDKGSDEY